MESKHSSLYITFPEYLKQPDNGNKNFNDYLLDYFREKAAPLILKALDGQFGLLSRIANDLSTIHPELSKSMVVDQFIAAVDFMDDTESQYRSDVLKRWCLASINIISRLFLDKEGKIKTKYLATLINNEKLTTIEEVSHYLYGEPEIPSRIKDIANQIVGSAMHAVVELVVGGLYKSPTNDHFVLQPAPLSHFSVDLIWKTTQLEPLFLRTKCSAIV